MCCGCDTFYIASVHIQCQASIYTLSLCRGHSWRVRLAKQETLTPPGHLVSPLVYRGPWMSTVVLYCWCHSDSASVLLYFTIVCRDGLNHALLLLDNLPNTHINCDLKKIHATDLNYKAVVLTKQVCVTISRLVAKSTQGNNWHQ